MSEKLKKIRQSAYRKFSHTVKPDPAFLSTGLSETHIQFFPTTLCPDPPRAACPAVKLLLALTSSNCYHYNTVYNPSPLHRLLRVEKVIDHLPLPSPETDSGIRHTIVRLSLTVRLPPAILAITNTTSPQSYADICLRHLRQTTPPETVRHNTSSDPSRRTPVTMSPALL